MLKLGHLVGVAVLLGQGIAAIAQPLGGPPDGPGGPGRGGFFGGGPPGQKEIELVEKFDKNDDGWLDRAERDAARKAVPARGERGMGRRPGGEPFGKEKPRDEGAKEGPGRKPGDDFRPEGPGDHERREGPPGGPGGPPGRMTREPAKAGPQMSPGEVESYAGKPLYDTSVLRTLFFEFEEQDWESEMAAFKATDVEVPATLLVDGAKYPNVGVKFRGMSSFMMVPDGYKRSLNVSLDLIDKEQRLDGYKTLNLLNCNGDPSLMSTVLYSEIAGQHLPTPKANFVRVVINGEYWGVYVNAQQIDKIFLQERFASPKGTRWKVPGNPGGDGGLRYLGDDLDEYKSRYEMKSNDGKKAWQAIVELCRVLKETPDSELEEALRPILNIDGALWFLALDNALVNSDGYWTRASDYYLFRDEKGVFHLIPSDINEAFHSGGPPGVPGGFGPPGGFPGGPPRGGGPRFGGGLGGEFGLPPKFDPERGPRGEADRFSKEKPGEVRPKRGHGPGGMNHGGVDLDPLIGLDDERTPLRGRLLKLPHLRAQYLEHVRAIANDSLDWKVLGPIVAKHRALIDAAVKADTRQLGSYDAFIRATAPEPASAAAPAATEAPAAGPPRRASSLRDFADKRRAYLLKYQDAPKGK